MERWALVAGGSGGVGRAVVRALAEDGWDVALTYLTNSDAAEAAAAAVLSAGRRAKLYQLDLVDAGATKLVVDDMATSCGLAGVVYAAGPHFGMRYVSATTPEYFGEILDVDAKACFNLLQPSISHLRETRGTILAVSTPAVRRYAKKDLLSSAPKAVVEAAVKAIASEEGRYGVRANCVQVGLLEGEGMWERLVQSGEYSAELLDTARRNTALGHFGDVTDIALAVQFLMSSRARWITGQVLPVDGGFSI